MEKRAQIILSFELTIASQEKIICTRYLRLNKKPYFKSFSKNTISTVFSLLRPDCI